MGISDPATAYGLFTGRFSEALAGEFANVVGPTPGQRVLDVGCGPGALTQVLAEQLGPPGRVRDGSLGGVRRGGPGAAARCRRTSSASAEAIPHDDDTFDAALAQLVVHFMVDPVAGLREMARVTRPAGVVAACVWDNAGGSGPLSPLWRAAQSLDPTASDESGAAGAREGELAALAREAGLVRVDSSRLTVKVPFETFDDWWGPLALGVGSGGAYVHARRVAPRGTLGAARESAGPAPFTVSASAWSVRAEVAGST